ncbi:hypothetical protein MASR2M8_24200 [Opitutaceae bacterium]
MHQIRTPQPPCAEEAGPRRQANPELRIAWERYAREADLLACQTLRDRASGRFMPLARPNDGDPVAAMIKAVHDASQRHGNAVDFGSVGFGDESEMQERCPSGGLASL